MPKIVFLDSFTTNPGDLDWAELRALGDLVLYDRTPPDQILKRSAQAEILITNKTPLTADTIAQLPELRLICVSATGYNIVDVAAARERNIPVCNVSGYSTAAVAQHVFALILAFTNRATRYSDEVHAGKWTSAQDFSYWHAPLIELAGQTLGIYGFGAIGQATARLALAFGMRVIAVHKHPARDAVREVDFVAPDTLWAESDWISLHVPLTVVTRGLINTRALRQMKPGAILINTGRGDLVVEADLRQALEEGTIAGAALDVLSSEPPASDNPLLGAPNCLITPHQAWASQEARRRLLAGVVDNIRTWQAGAPRHVVNAPH
jgi:glycerate dehydrogenase